VNAFLDTLMSIVTDPFLMGVLSIVPICWLIQYWVTKDMSPEEFAELLREVEENRQETIGVM
jgi:hypothetical protein